MKQDLKEIQEDIIHMVKRYQRGKHKRWHRRTLRRAIQFWTDEREHIFSQEAMEFCLTNNVNVKTLTAYNLKKKTGGKKNRPTLTLEHTTPINELITLLNESEEKDMMNILEAYSPCCFITQEENDRLNKNKFKMKRPGGWKKCYEKCEIRLAV